MADYALITATRYDRALLNCRWNDDQDGPSHFCLLNHHFDRLKSASELHRRSFPLSFSTFKLACKKAVPDEDKAFKVIQDSSMCFLYNLYNIDTVAHCPLDRR